MKMAAIKIENLIEKAKNGRKDLFLIALSKKNILTDFLDPSVQFEPIWRGIPYLTVFKFHFKFLRKVSTSDLNYTKKKFFYFLI